MEYNELLYTDANGIAVTGLFISLEDSVSHRTSAFNFINSDGAYVQDKSVDNKKLPLTILLTEDDRTSSLSEWRSALDSIGTGKLQHPDRTIGTKNVIVLSYSVSQSIDTNGQITISVEFVETIPNLLDTDSTLSAAKQIGDETDTIADNLAELAKSEMNNLQAGALKNTADAIISGVTAIQKNLDGITRLSDTLYQEYLTSLATITNNVDNFARAPFLVIRAFNNLLKLPALTSASLNDKIDSYKNFVQDIVDSFNDISIYESDGNKNIAFLTGTYAVLGLANLSYSLVLSDYNSRDEAIDKVNFINVYSGEVLDGLDSVVLAFNNFLWYNRYIDRGIDILSIIKIASADVYTRALDLQAAKYITLDSDTTIIELVYNTYGSVDDEYIYRLINNNNLTKDDMYMIPKGKKLKIV